MQVTVNFTLSNDEIAKAGGLQSALLACIGAGASAAPTNGPAITPDHAADGLAYGHHIPDSPFAGHTSPGTAEPYQDYEEEGARQVTSGFSPDVVVDADGLPWDQRIHSSNQKKTATGHWQRRRNLEAGIYERVAGEILAGAGKAAPQFANTPVQSYGAAFPTDNSFVQPPAQQSAPAISFPTDNGAGAAQVAAPAQQAAAPATATSPVGAWTFPRFLKAHAAAVQAGRSSDEAMSSVLQAFSIASLPFLASRPQDIPSVAAALQYEMPQ